MTIPKTKEEIIKVLKEYNAVRMPLKKFCDDNSYFVCSIITSYIHITSEAFDKIVEVLQPIVHYDANWLVSDTCTTGCKSFNIDIDGNLIKIMALWKFNVQGKEN